MLTYKIQEYDEIDKNFYRNEVLFEASRVDGMSMDDFIRGSIEGDKFFIACYKDDKLISLMSCKTDEDGVSEVHTFVLPEYKKLSPEIINKQIDFVRKSGAKCVVTSCSSKNLAVKNFLIKRIGFEVIRFIPDTSAIKDGERLDIYVFIKRFKKSYGNKRSSKVKAKSNQRRKRRNASR